MKGFLRDETLETFADSLYSVDVITDDLHDNPTYNKIEKQFTLYLECLSEKEEIEEHCRHFIQALMSVGGPMKRIAVRLRDEWIKEVNNELHIKLCLL